MEGCKMDETTLIKTVTDNIIELKRDLLLWKCSSHKDKKTIQIIEDLRKEIKAEQWKLDQAKVRIEKALFKGN